jgi:hypothetical protein
VFAAELGEDATYRRGVTVVHPFHLTLVLVTVTGRTIPGEPVADQVSRVTPDA